MRLHLDNNDVRKIATGCLVIGITDGGELGPSARAIDDASGGVIEAMIENGDIQTKPGKTTLLHRLPGVEAGRVLAVGLGKTEKLTLARFHRACLAAAKLLRDHPGRHCRN